MKDKIIIDKISFSYINHNKEVKVFDKFSLILNNGEVTFLTGKNGSGGKKRLGKNYPDKTDYGNNKTNIWQYKIIW